MIMPKAIQTGGQVAAQSLYQLGARLVFSVSGNQVLPFYDAAADNGLRIIHMRHEAASAFAAAGRSEITGQPGVLMTSAGPAFLAALTGVATVRAMELPLVFLSGDSPIRNAGFGTFQELNQQAVCREVCKASFKPATVDAIPGALNDAWLLSQAGIPGPVHVSLPADVLLASAETPAHPLRHSAEEIHAPSELLQSMAHLLMNARRPLVMARPAAARGRAGELLELLANKLGVQPIITGPPRGLADSRYSHLVPLYKQSDCALVIGPSDYALSFLDESVIAGNGSVLLIDAVGDPKPRRIPTVHLQELPQSAMQYLLNALADYTADREWSGLWLAPARPHARPQPDAGPLHPLEVAAQIRAVLQPDDVLVVDGGEFCQWIRLGLHDVPNRWLWNSKVGIIGNSIPMAIGIAACGHKGRTIAIMGDGGCGYHLMEFETAARCGVPFVAIIGNDAKWGAEWHLQVERYGAGRTFETELSPARYDQAAAGLGAAGFHVQDAAELRPALEAALAAGRPACVNVLIQSLKSPAAAP